ncbi:MAG: glycosyltransferase family 4 protein [Bacteroidales bacterium]
MNILLLNHYAGNPKFGMEFRPFYLAKEWTKQGHKVLIVGGTFSHLRKIQPQAGRENYDGIDYLWLKTNSYSSNGLKRVLSMFLFVFQLFIHIKSFTQFKPDAVIASSTYPLDIYPARYIAKKNKAKLVFEIHDLWPLSPMELGHMSKYHPFIMLMQMAENYAYKHCDTCVSILPCVHEHVKAHGLDLKKLHLVPNGVVIEDWENLEPLPPEASTFFEELKENGKFIVGYAGGHTLSNALDYFIEARKFIVDDSVVFVLVGNGVKKHTLEQKVKMENISNIYFLPPVPKLQIPSLLSLMDVLYVGGAANPLYRFGISPNKIFDYMMASKPIIQPIQAANDMITEASCGIPLESENPQAVADAIMKLKGLTPEQRKILGENGHTYVLKNHTYAVLTERFLTAIK